jgi:hypothetical protein
VKQKGGHLRVKGVGVGVGVGVGGESSPPGHGTHTLPMKGISTHFWVSENAVCGHDGSPAAGGPRTHVAPGTKL